jgi:hypothetical protein
MRRWLLVILLAACGGKSGRAICEKAATRFEGCVKETLGTDFANMLHGKDLGIDVCAKDDPTVAMYRECLPKTTCTEFMDCMEGFARDHAPKIAGDLSRSEQCGQYVANGRRAIALQTIMLGENDDKTQAQLCLSDEANQVDTCIGAVARAEVDRYAKERQRQCEKWSDELAACVMHLPSAHDCKPDEEPLWSLPVESGATGPAIAWSTTLATDKELEDRDFAWAANHVLVVADASGLRALQGGKELWRAPAGAPQFTVAGSWVVPEKAAHGTGAVLDVATGESIGSLPDGQYGAGNDRIVGRNGDNIVEVKCAAKRCTAKPIGKLGEMDWPEHVVVRRDGFVLVDYRHLWFYDRAAKLRLELKLADSGHTVFTTAGLAIVDDSGIVSLSLEDCVQQGTRLFVPTAKQLAKGLAYGEAPELDDCENCRLATHGCIESHQRLSDMMSPRLVAMPNGGIAFNDDGIAEKTHAIGPDGTWIVETKSHGDLAADERNVYTISWVSEVDPPQLLALARDSGKARWHVDLVGAKAVDHAKVVLGDGYLAARAGDKLFVMQLPTKLTQQ